MSATSEKSQNLINLIQESLLDLYKFTQSKLNINENSRISKSFLKLDPITIIKQIKILYDPKIIEASKISQKEIIENELSEEVSSDMNNEYETMIQKLEGEIRQHIRIEQQLKIHIDSVQAKMEEYEKEIECMKKKLKQNESSKGEIDKMISTKDVKINSLNNKVNELESMNKRLIQTLNSENPNKKINILKTQNNHKISNINHLFSHSPFTLSKEAEQIIKNNEKLNQKNITEISRKTNEKITPLLTTRDRSNSIKKSIHKKNQENNAIIANSKINAEIKGKESQNENNGKKIAMINEKYCNLQKQLTDRNKKCQISNTLVNGKKNLSKSPLISSITIARNKLGIHENKTTFVNNENNHSQSNYFEKDQRSLSISQLQNEINESSKKLSTFRQHSTSMYNKNNQSMGIYSRVSKNSTLLKSTNTQATKSFIKCK